MENVKRRQSHIPNELFISILSKLPIKSLKRFECACKSWSLLFDNPNFKTIYRNSFFTKDHSYYNDKSLLLHTNNFPFCFGYGVKYELYSVSGERFENRVKLDWPINPHYEYKYGFGILGCGSVNGILCLLCDYRGKNVIFWNPSTEEFKVIPLNFPGFMCLVDYRGFGYDHIKDDYKVLRCCGGINPETFSNSDIEEQISSIWEIYSLKSNSWKKLELDMNHKSIHWNKEFHVYMDGLSHNLGRDERDDESCLISFDWSNEVFVTTPLFLDIDNFYLHYKTWTKIVLINGSIASITNFEDMLHISILGELGVKESWIKILIIGPFHYLDYPIGAGKKGDMMFRKRDGGLVWFDLNTQMIEDLGIRAEIFTTRLFIHGENLIPFEGNNI